MGDERVLAFRAELLRRWPDLMDMIAPWHHDLGWRQPWGRTDLADRFVGLTLPFRWKDTAELPALDAVLAGTVRVGVGIVAKRVEPALPVVLKMVLVAGLQPVVD